MTDYSTPEARQALQREIAETLGWADIETGYWYEGDEDGAMRSTELFGTSPDGDKHELIPHYSESVDAAITLPLAGKDGISVAIGNGAYTVAIDPVNLMQFVISRKIKDTSPLTTQIATTICQVWLEYRRVMKTEAR